MMLNLLRLTFKYNILDVYINEKVFAYVFWITAYI